MIASIGVGIYAQVVELLIKNTGMTEKEIYRSLEMNDDLIEACDMARKAINEDELAKRRNSKKKN